MATPRYDRTIPEVLADLLGQLTILLRKEGQLVRAEISEKIAQMGTGVALVIAGAVLLMPALVILLEAGVAGIEQAGIAPHWAWLIVGGGAVLIGLILVMVGVNRLKAEKLVPKKTIHQLQEDASVAKRQMRKDDEYQQAA